MNIFPPKIKKNRGMTYVELIVVLSIFSMVTSVSLFNHRKFQERERVKQVASQMALKMVELQKNAYLGKYPKTGFVPSVTPWKPSYGFMFKGNSQTYFFFTDLNNNKLYTGSILNCTVECLSSMWTNPNVANLTEVRYFLVNDNVGTRLVNQTNETLHITYTRPNTAPEFYYGSFAGATKINNMDYVQVTYTSPQNARARIRMYASGRVEVLN